MESKMYENISILGFNKKKLYSEYKIFNGNYFSQVYIWHKFWNRILINQKKSCYYKSAVMNN